MLKQVLVAATLSAAALAASATAYTITVTPQAPAVYSNVASVSGPSFSDTYSFLSPVASSMASASGVTIDVGTLLGIDALSIKLFDSSNTLVLAGTSGESSTLVDVPLLSNASYYFEVTGNVTGTGGGIYSFIATTSPVPEPETWALLLGGLAAVGFVIFRRKSN